MNLFEISGVFLLLLSILSSIPLYLKTFQHKEEDIAVLVAFFLASLVFGTLFYSIGIESWQGLKIAAGLCLFYGAISLIVIFLNVINIINIRRMDIVYWFAIVGFLFGVLWFGINYFNDPELNG